jgi:hypothetical protein
MIEGTHGVSLRPRVLSRSEARQATPGASIAGERARAPGHHRGGRREVGIMHPQCGLFGARAGEHPRYSPYALLITFHPRPSHLSEYAISAPNTRS